MEKVYHLIYTKEFKDSKTTHSKISRSKEKLFEWIKSFCENMKLELVKSESQDHQFLFADGDWVYYGKSEFLNVRFSCYQTELI